MKTHQFLCLKDNIINRVPKTLEELIIGQITVDKFLQYYGFSDADNTPICEGDVLVLHITEDLMNPQKNMFFNSNLGKEISKDGHITHVLCVLEYDNNFIGCPYTIYFCHDNHIDLDEDGEPLSVCRSNDNNFPMYLINKGAVIENNIIVNNHAITDWKVK